MPDTIFSGQNEGEITMRLGCVPVSKQAQGQTGWNPTLMAKCRTTLTSLQITTTFFSASVLSPPARIKTAQLSKTSFLFLLIGD